METEQLSPIRLSYNNKRNVLEVRAHMVEAKKTEDGKPAPPEDYGFVHVGDIPLSPPTRSIETYDAKDQASKAGYMSLPDANPIFEKFHGPDGVVRKKYAKGK